MIDNSNIVIIGGGTGLSVLLRGLKKQFKNITAIVNVVDDGGGSGILREDLGMLPPGDIRNCILALANTEPVMEELMQYRFDEGVLKGQSFGNLMIAALDGISESFESAIKKISAVFAITGQVLPVSEESITLNAYLENGCLVKGESSIPKAVLNQDSPIKKVFLTPMSPKLLPRAKKALQSADLIIIGPGSLYTSIVPNLLVDEVAEIICQSKAKKVYISNLMTQPGETDHYGLKEHVQVIEKFLGKNCLEAVIANNRKVDQPILEKYLLEKSQLIDIIEADKRFLDQRNIRLIEDDFTEVKLNYLRHNAFKVSQTILELLDVKVYHS